MYANKKIKIIFSLLVIFTVTAGYFLLKKSSVEHQLLPAQQSIVPWHSFTSTDVDQGGNSSVDLRESTYNLNYDFTLAAGSQYPYVSLGLTFDDETDPAKLIDWSEYSSIWFRIKCRPNNVLSFVLHTYDDAATRPNEITTYRPALTFISCNETWQDVEVNLHRLETPDWWLRQYNVDLSNRSYRLEKVKGISITTSPQSQENILSSVTIEAITLNKKNWRLIYISVSLLLLIWGAFLYWYFLLIAKQKKIPAALIVKAVPYQQVTVESKVQRDTSSVLDYLASAYTNPDLNVDTVVKSLGINRAKINDILRDETGLTFSSYLNKLRLTEAIRLLKDKQMSVSEAAFSVGYSSLSYFNRVFKKEFGCAPSSYKNIAISASAQDDSQIHQD